MTDTAFVKGTIDDATISWADRHGSPRHMRATCSGYSQTHRTLSPWAFLVWSPGRSLGGDRPFFHFSQTWQMLINSSTTVVTF
jgi:hypothetical protein